MHARSARTPKRLLKLRLRPTLRPLPKRRLSLLPRVTVSLPSAPNNSASSLSNALQLHTKRLSMRQKLPPPPRPPTIQRPLLPSRLAKPPKKPWPRSVWLPRKPSRTVWLPRKPRSSSVLRRSRLPSSTRKRPPPRLQWQRPQRQPQPNTKRPSANTMPPRKLQHSSCSTNVRRQPITRSLSG